MDELVGRSLAFGRRTIGALNLAGGYWYITITRSSPLRA
jgi:hypothetical protein